MVDIKPFRGLQYSDSFKDNMGSVVSPPYDIIPPDLKESLKNQSEYNIVKLILPDPDGSTSDIYKAASNKLEEWINNEILVKDDNEYFYIIEESFEMSGSIGKMVGLIAITKIEEYETKNILRHEKTLKKPREDRLNLLKACRTNFGLIYMLYDDDKGEIEKVINSQMEMEPDIEFRPFYDESLYFKLWRITKKHDADLIIDLMKEEQPLIADGHHRYETSRTYKHLAPGPKGGPQDYILTLFVSGRSKDISIHPTHRVINFSPEFEPGYLLEKASRLFEYKKIDGGDLVAATTMIADASKEGRKALSVYFGDKGLYILTLKKEVSEIYGKDEDINLDYEELDVNILHRLLLEKSLEGRFEDIKYIHTLDELKEEIDSNRFQAGFILNPPSIETVKRLSVQDQVMPQKSTYFYPKPCTGLVTYRFE